ncbi:MAG: nucleotidyl transferase AbiEii/AbiGii toxin family protein [Cytophagales bacterium]|nr:nucleotidyl transferase AbiEii/AbiGii toxin family protein [Cytophagales bacterium]
METKILSETCTVFLQKIKENDFLKNNFYLTGGTALAAFYLNHRYSEDLDFFSENQFDVSELNVFLNGLKKQLGIKKIDFQQSLNRNIFFVHFNEEVLRIEFTYFPFPRIERGRREYGIEIDSILDIAVNKLFTIYQRSKARDYIDLYYLCTEKGYSITELIAMAKAKFDFHIGPLQLGTQFLKAKEVKDYPKMIKEIQHEVWKSFFIEEAKKFKKDILN